MKTIWINYYLMTYSFFTEPAWMNLKQTFSGFPKTRMEMKRVYNCQVWLLEHIIAFTSHPQRPHHRPCSDCVIMFRLERLNGPISVYWKSTSGSCTIGLSYISLLLCNIFSWYQFKCYYTYQRGTLRVWGTNGLNNKYNNGFWLNTVW